MSLSRKVLLGCIAAIVVAAGAIAGDRALLFRATFIAKGTGAAERSGMDKMRDVVSVKDFTGADVGAQANAAFAACSGCTVLIPDGAYSYSTTINFPMVANGTSKLVCDAGVVLTYTGSGYAFEALGAGQAYANVEIEGCHFTGTSSGLAGIHLRAFNGGLFTKIKVDGFTTGEGIKNEGANTIEYVSTALTGNKYGLHNVGVVVNALNYSVNASRFIGGQINSNTTWGVWEDGALSATVGPNLGNVYIGVQFTNNGTNATAASGHIFGQRCDQLLIQGGYFEYAAMTVPYAITLGDGTYTCRGPSIRNSWFGSSGSTATINDVRTDGLFVGGNSEVAATTNFLIQAAASVNTVVETNNYSAVVTPFTGTDSGNTVWWGSATNLINATQPTARGRSFNSISGLDQNLRIRIHGTGNQIVFEDRDGTAMMAVNSMSQVGKNTIGSYNGTGTVGYGVPVMHGSFLAQTAKTSDLAATSVYAAAPVGEYRVCATARTTTSGTGTVATLNIIWTDEGGVKTDAVGTWALNSVTVTGQINKCEYVHAAAATNIQVSVSGGTYGTSVYAISASAERLN